MKTMDQIIASLPQFDGNSRKIEHVSVRQAFCYLAYKAGYQVYEIGRFIHRDHSTVIHSVNKVEELISIKDKRIMRLINTKN